MLREPLPMREIFTRMCLIEIHTLKNDTTAIQAKVLYNDLISLHVQFIQNQIKLIEFYEDVDEFYYVDIFDSIQRKAVHLAITLKNIFHSQADESTPSLNNCQGNIHTDRTDTASYEFLSPEQRLFIKMIESLRWNNDICSAEAEVLLNKVGFAYESFVRNQQNTARCVENDLEFEKQLEISSDIQREVTLVENKLRRIIASEVTESAILISESESSTESDETVIQLDNPAKKSYNHLDTFESSDLSSPEQRQFVRTIEWLEWNNDPSPAEAEVLLTHLESAYELFLRDQLNIAHCHCAETHPNFEKQLQISTNIQRKMINLKTRLEKIIKPNERQTTFSTFESSSELSNLSCDISTEILLRLSI